MYTERQIVFSQNLQYLRKEKNLLQRQVYIDLGVKRSTWSNYENGIAEPSMLILARIASYYGVSIDDLVTKIMPVEMDDCTTESTAT